MNLTQEKQAHQRFINKQNESLRKQCARRKALRAKRIPPAIEMSLIARIGHLRDINIKQQKELDELKGVIEFYKLLAKGNKDDQNR